MRRLNPGWKMLSLILASLLLSTTFNIRVNLLTAAFALLLAFSTPGVDRKRLLLTMVPFFLAAFGMFMGGLLAGDRSGGVSGVELTVFGQRTLYASDLKTAMQLASRILAYGGLGMLFAFTSDAFEFIMSLMQQFHLPPKFAYGILAAYHFFPVVSEEYRIVGAAMKVRGAKAGPFSPKRLMPMFAQALERSQSLAMAMESRGFEDGAPRAVAFRTTAGWKDCLFLVLLNGGIAAGLLLLK
ncbi:MAG: energy-coupling factor transporter transmembrane protein EcfT [Lachnospiraceae bacterium]|nr:energy-coupling factor transporter transmembrane protein EcfT [Lachnospiraceae bacterium]